MKSNQTTRVIVFCVVVAVAAAAVVIYRDAETDRVQKEREARAKQDAAMMNGMNRKDVETYKINTKPADLSGYKPFGSPKVKPETEPGKGGVSF